MQIIDHLSDLNVPLVVIVDRVDVLDHRVEDVSDYQLQRVHVDVQEIILNLSEILFQSLV